MAAVDPSREPLVRFDDLAAAPSRHWRLQGLIASGAAWHAQDVTEAIETAAQYAECDGRWVVLAIAYESGPALDPALVAQPAPPAGQPFVQWAAFEHRVDAGPLPRPGTATRGAARATSSSAFERDVQVIRERIARGDVYQVNHTDRITGVVDDPLGLYASLLAGQSCAFGSYLDLGHGAIASASPELFFRWEGDTITCRPMKGTRPRHPRRDIDLTRATDLALSAKDRAENVMIVDLLRNDLGRLARPGSVRVPELFTTERYETVWQLTSTVQAEVAPATSLLAVLRALFPCGSVTGAPKIAAMGIIDELEHAPRGIYCGALGLLAPPGCGPRAVFSVPIRTAVVRAGTVLYGAGAGITWSSVPADEDAEVNAKARVLTDPWPSFELLETLRLDENGLLHVQQHLERLAESASWFAVPLDRAAISAALAATAPRLAPHRVRLLVDRAGAWRIECAPLDAAPDVVALAIDTEVTRSDDVFCCHKTTARAHYSAALARHTRADDVVLVNERGNAIETTAANLAYRIGARWFTPPLSDGGLAGVGRRIELESGLLCERSIPAAELAGCDELAVLSDLRGRRRAMLLAP